MANELERIYIGTRKGKVGEKNAVLARSSREAAQSVQSFLVALQGNYKRLTNVEIEQVDESTDSSDSKFQIHLRARGE